MDYKRKTEKDLNKGRCERETRRLQYFFFFVEKVKLGYRTKAWTIIRQSREVCLLQFENTVAQKSSVHRLLYISV